MAERLRIQIENGLERGRSGTCKLKGQFTIGRGSTADLSVIDLRMSREHFAVRRDETSWIVEDLSSQHGTKINGESIRSTRRLQHGDLIEAGDTLFRVIVERRRFLRFLSQEPVEFVGSPARNQQCNLNDSNRE